MGSIIFQRDQLGASGSMSQATIPSELLESVVAYFHPRRTILFGSQARGDALPDSDIDLVVILDDDAPPEMTTLKAGFESRRGYHRATDVIPVRESTYSRTAKSPAPVSPCLARVWDRRHTTFSRRARRC